MHTLALFQIIVLMMVCAATVAHKVDFDATIQADQNDEQSRYTTQHHAIFTTNQKKNCFSGSWFSESTSETCRKGTI